MKKPAKINTEDVQEKFRSLLRLVHLGQRLHRRTKDNMDKQRRVNGISLRQTN